MRVHGTVTQPRRAIACAAAVVASPAIAAAETSMATLWSAPWGYTQFATNASSASMAILEISTASLHRPT